MPDIYQILSLYKELPSDSAFNAQVENYSTSQFIRVVHESNMLEDTGPKNLNQTVTMGDDLAYYLLLYLQKKIKNCYKDIEQLKKSGSKLNGKYSKSNVRRFFQDYLNAEGSKIKAFLEEQGVDGDTPFKKPEVTNHILALSLNTYFFRMLAIMFREIKAETAMQEKDYDLKKLAPLVLLFIKGLHRTLMYNIMENGGESGLWKNNDNNLGYGGPLTYSHTDVPEIMNKWGNKLLELLMEAVKGEQNVFEVCAWATHSFLVIHPFSDGNGRMARILLNSILMGFGEVPFPIVISEGTSKGKKKYVKALRKADQKNESILFFSDFEYLKKYTELIEQGTYNCFKEIDNKTLEINDADYRSFFL